MIKLVTEYPEILKEDRLPASIYLAQQYSSATINTDEKTNEEEDEDMYILQNKGSVSKILITAYLSKPISKIINFK